MWEDNIKNAIKSYVNYQYKGKYTFFQLDAQQRYTLFQRGLWEAAQQIPRGAVRDFATFRQLRLLSTIGPAALPPDQLDRVSI